MLTRNDYVLIAKALNDAKPNTKEEIDCWMNICLSLTKALKTINERFDEKRFLHAVTVK